MQRKQQIDQVISKIQEIKYFKCKKTDDELVEELRERLKKCGGVDGLKFIKRGSEEDFETRPADYTFSHLLWALFGKPDEDIMNSNKTRRDMINEKNQQNNQSEKC